MNDNEFSLTDDAAVAEAEGQKGADVANKSEKAKPGRTKEGKSRLAEKAAQHAAPAEPAKAEKKQRGGTKPDQPKRKPGANPAGGFEVPRGVLKWLEPAELTFDPAHQKRTQLFDEFTVEKYKEQYEDAKGKPQEWPNPGERLKELRAVDTGETLYVWDGFQRGEAATRAGIEKLPVLVVKGTKEDAEFYALRANFDHGLARSSNDCRRAVFSVIDTPELMQRVDAKKDEVGGLVSALAIATGTSRGHVSNCLHQRGLTVRKGKLAKLPEKRDKATTPAAPAKADDKPKANTGPAATIQADPAHVRDSGNLFAEEEAADRAADASNLTGDALIAHLRQVNETASVEQQSAQIKATATRVLVDEAAKTAAKLVRQVLALSERDDVALMMYKRAAELLVPFGSKEDEQFPEFGSGSNVPKLVSRTTWPVLDTVLLVLERTKADVSAAQVKADENPGEVADTDKRFAETPAGERTTAHREAGESADPLPADPVHARDVVADEPPVPEETPEDTAKIDAALAEHAEAEARQEADAEPSGTLFNPDFDDDKPVPADKAAKYPAKKKPKAKAKK